MPQPLNKSRIQVNGQQDHFGPQSGHPTQVTCVSFAETVWFSGVARLRLTTAAVAIINKDNFFFICNSLNYSIPILYSYYVNDSISHFNLFVMCLTEKGKESRY
ncbi:hypothetical protein M1GAS476_0183 [Streptococcus pyogenes M1 476]|nr:hypothetical protein M1GAS476_0183 [Streptococcus pyogenes M1 476]